MILLCAILLFAATPAEQRIIASRQTVAVNARSSQAFDDLASALCDRARETGNPAFYEEAQAVLLQGSQFAPEDYTAKKIHIVVLLGLHRSQEALNAAMALNKLVPDDIPVWGYLSEANFQLGNYAEAEKAAQWMFDLRPGNSAGFVPSAKLREVSGDLEGAIDYLNEAYRRTAESEFVQRAYLLSEVARIQDLNGNSTRAKEFVQLASKLFPDEPQTLKVSASLYPDQAVRLLARHSELTHTTASLYEYAEALQASGQSAHAAEIYKVFEQRAEAESHKPQNANCELIFYYANRTKQQAKALALAEWEISNRHNIAARDAYAWALYRSGRTKEAVAQLRLAKATGTRDRNVAGHLSLIGP